LRRHSFSVVTWTSLAATLTSLLVTLTLTSLARSWFVNGTATSIVCQHQVGSLLLAALLVTWTGAAFSVVSALEILSGALEAKPFSVERPSDLVPSGSFHL